MTLKMSTIIYERSVNLYDSPIISIILHDLRNNIVILIKDYFFFPFMFYRDITRFTCSLSIEERASLCRQTSLFSRENVEVEFLRQNYYIVFCEELQQKLAREVICLRNSYERIMEILIVIAYPSVINYCC